MARARNLKPSFFTNEDLAEQEPLTRLLFAGLWTIADRAGRLEDRPKRIKTETLPYDECDVDAMLDALHEAGFILRYVASGSAYIQILAFSKHQNPHVKEGASTIPAPCENGASTVQAPEIPERAGPLTDSISPLPIPPSIPDGVRPEVWESWKRHRGKLSGESVKRQAAKLRELEIAGNDPNLVILQSIDRGWSGLFEVKAKRGSKGDRRAETARAMVEAVLGDGNERRSDEPRDITGESRRLA